MKFPVDEDMFAAWSTLLGLTPEQTRDVTDEIEAQLRRGYTFRPLALRHLSFEQLTADMDVDELALMFLVEGLKKTGHNDAAEHVFSRALRTQILPTRTD